MIKLGERVGGWLERVLGMWGRKKERQEGRKKGGGEAQEGESGRKEAAAVKKDIEEVEIKGKRRSDYGKGSQDKERKDEGGSEAGE